MYECVLIAPAPRVTDLASVPDNYETVRAPRVSSLGVHITVTVSTVPGPNASARSTGAWTAILRLRFVSVVLCAFGDRECFALRTCKRICPRTIIAPCTRITDRPRIMLRKSREATQVLLKVPRQFPATCIVNHNVARVT